MTDSARDVREGDIYLYKLTCDNGGAPCVHHALLSLAICKPDIRKAANMGDWIIGFGGKSVPDLKDRLIYIAKVTSVEEDGAYYKDARYRGRPDRIYRFTNPGYEYIPRSRFHDKDDLAHDLGSPPHFERARVLLSDTFAYFGDNPGPALDGVRDIYEGLPRNFAKHHPPQARERLEAFIVSAFEQFGPGVHGKPTHGDSSMKCHSSEDEIVTIPKCSR